jgi:UDP-N-acetylglucosamine:LPS N-acetylglucosamine transferase
MKVLIIFTKAGGGHETCAKAIYNELKEGNQVELFDFSKKDKVSTYIFSDFYTILIEKLYPIWILLTLFWKSRIGIYISKKIFEFNFKRYINSKVKEFNPDIVISTYFFTSDIVKQYDKEIKVFTIVSELYDAPIIWFDSNDVEYIITNQKIYDKAINYGIDKNRLNLFTVFFKKLTFESNVVLGIKDDYITLVGGGSSLPRGVELVKKLKSSSIKEKIIVICGRNAKLEYRLRKLTTDDQRFVILGFVPLNDILKGSNLVVTKAGPAIITELLSLKTPFITYFYIWEQELGNVQYLKENRLSVYEPNLNKLIEKIENHENDNDFKIIKANIANTQIVNSIERIAKFIIS